MPGIIGKVKSSVEKQSAPRAEPGHMKMKAALAVSFSAGLRCGKAD
jgi:hypothetical protein